MKFPKLFKVKCFFCPEMISKFKCDKIHIQHEDGKVIKASVCKKCADTLEAIRLKDLIN